MERYWIICTPSSFDEYCWYPIGVFAYRSEKDSVHGSFMLKGAILEWNRRCACQRFWYGPDRKDDFPCNHDPHLQSKWLVDSKRWQMIISHFNKWISANLDRVPSEARASSGLTAHSSYHRQNKTLATIDWNTLLTTLSRTATRARTHNFVRTNRTASIIWINETKKKFIQNYCLLSLSYSIPHRQSLHQQSWVFVVVVGVVDVAPVLSAAYVGILSLFPLLLSADSPIHPIVCQSIDLYTNRHCTRRKKKKKKNVWNSFYKLDSDVQCDSLQFTIREFFVPNHIVW